MAARLQDQVVFKDVPKSYPIGGDIVLHYSVSTQQQLSTADWIGVFKVGWAATNDYQYFVWAAIPTGYVAGQAYDSAVTFESSRLPNDDSDFYQFCYVNEKGQVVGVSKPFQFKKSSVDDYFEIEEADMLIVTSKTVALEERLEKITSEINELIKVKKILDEDRECLGTKLAQSEKNLEESCSAKDALATKLKTLEVTNADLNARAEEMRGLSKSQTDRITSLEQEKRDLCKSLEKCQEEIRCLQSEIKVLRNELDSMNGKVQMLVQEKELFKGHLTAAESTRLTHALELSTAKKQLDALRGDHASHSTEIEQLQQSISKERGKCERLLQISQQDHDCIERLREKCEHAEDKLAAAEQCKRMYACETSSLQEMLTCLNEQIEKVKTENHSLKQSLQQLNENSSKLGATSEREAAQYAVSLKRHAEEREQLSVEVATLKQQLKDQKEQASEVAAAKVQQLTAQDYAIIELNERLAAVSTERDLLAENEKALRQTEQNLQGELDELKGRLQAGQREWTKLYRDNVTLSKKIRRASRTGMASSSREGSLEDDTSGIVSPAQFGRAGADLAIDELHLRMQHLNTQRKLGSLVCENDGDGHHWVLPPLLQHSRSSGNGTSRDPDDNALRLFDEGEVQLLRLKPSKPAEMSVQLPDGTRISHGKGSYDDFDGIDGCLTSGHISDAQERNKGSEQARIQNTLEKCDFENESSCEAPPRLDNCCICHMLFDSDWSVRQRTEHINGHLADHEATERKCPLCSQAFSAEYGQIAFENHVHQHFTIDQ